MIRSARLFVLACVALSALACTRHARWHRAFHDQHPDCWQEIEGELREGDRNAYDLVACGRSESIFRECMGPTCRFNSTAALRRRIAFEAQCHERDVELVELARGQMGAIGCGQRQVYVSTPFGWMLDGRAGVAPTPSEPEDGRVVDELDPP